MQIRAQADGIGAACLLGVKLMSGAGGDGGREERGLGRKRSGE
jgi:hypothetical protein